MKKRFVSAVVAGGVNFSNTNDAPTATNLSSTSSYNEGDPTVAITDIVVSGSIEQSNGEYVTLDITVEDASGRHWYDRTYETQTGVTSFSDRRDRRHGFCRLSPGRHPVCGRDHTSGAGAGSRRAALDRRRPRGLV